MLALLVGFFYVMLIGLINTTNLASLLKTRTRAITDNPVINLWHEPVRGEEECR